MGIVRSKYYGIMRGITVGISFFSADCPDDLSRNVSDEIFHYCVFCPGAGECDHRIWRW